MTAFPPKLLPLVCIVVFGSLALGVPLPALPLYLHGVLGYDTFTTGAVVGVQSLATVLTRQLAGNYCDRHGSRFSVLLGLPLATLAGLFYLLAYYMPTGVQNLGVLVVGRLVMGLAESLILTGTMTWGIGRLGHENTGTVMAWQGIAAFGAIGVGAPMGIAVMQRWGFVGVSITTICLPLAGLAVALSIAALPVATGASRAPRGSFASIVGLIWRPSVAMALGTMSFPVITTFLVLYFGARQWAGAGLAVTAFTVGYIGVRLFIAHWPDQFGGWRVGAASVGVQIAGLLCLAWAATPAWAFFATTLTGCGLSLVFPAMGVEAVRAVPSQSRGTAVACFLAFIDVGIGLTGPLIGALIAHEGYGAAFVASACCCAVALGLMTLRRGAQSPSPLPGLR